MANVFKELEKNRFTREMRGDSSIVMPPVPEEVLSWNDGLQELLCYNSVENRVNVMSWEAANREAIETVKLRTDFLFGKNDRDSMLDSGGIVFVGKEVTIAETRTLD